MVDKAHAGKQRARRNAITSEISFKSVVDARRWCQLQAWQARPTLEPLQVEALARWVSRCRQSVPGAWASRAFNAFDLDPAAIEQSIVDVFAAFELLDIFGIPREHLLSFLSDLRDLYRQQNPYHNWFHAVDVFQMVCHILVGGGAVDDLSPNSVFVVLLAALTHDIDHPSICCAQSSPPRAASLELYHAAQTDRLLCAHPTLLANIDNSANFRAQIVECILSTDISMDARWRSDWPSIAEGHHQTSRLMQLIIRCADVSNVCRPLPVASCWSQALAMEITGKPEWNKASTVTFCRDLARPLYELLAQTWPATSDLLEALDSNCSQWTAEEVEPVSPNRKR